MAVYRRGGRYWIDFYFGVDENGKPKRLRIPSSENHKEAKAALDRIRGRISSGDFRPEELEPATPTESDGVLFDRVAELYVERKIADGKRADSYGWLFRTDRATKEIIPGPWLQAFGGRPVASITSDEIETHLSAWTKARGLTPATRNRALSQVSGALSFAFRRGWLREHPIRFGRVERFAEDNVRERWLRPHEIQALATQARADGRAYLADVI
jgi:hypothetical protein